MKAKYRPIMIRLSQYFHIVRLIRWPCSRYSLIIFITAYMANTASRLNSGKKMNGQLIVVDDWFSNLKNTVIVKKATRNQANSTICLKFIVVELFGRIALTTRTYCTSLAWNHSFNCDLNILCSPLEAIWFILTCLILPISSFNLGIVMLSASF